MKRMKKFLKNSLVTFFAIAPLAATPLLTIFYFENQKSSNNIYMKDLGNSNSEKVLPPNDINSYPVNSPEYLEFKDGLYKDAYNKATYDPDSILVYSIYYFGVLHRFALIAHLLTVLEINSDHVIFLMETSGRNDYSLLLENDPISGKRKYPNVYIYEDENFSEGSDNWWLLINRYISPIDFFNKVSQKKKELEIQKPGKQINIHGYFADIVLKTIIDNYFMGNNIPILKKNINDYWLFFNEYSSFSIFSDGTLSDEFFSTKFYNYLLKSNIGEWDETTGEYSNLIKLRRELLKNKNNSLNEILKDNNSILFILSIMMTKDFNGDNVYPDPGKLLKANEEKKYYDSQFLFAATQSINDINNRTIEQNNNSTIKWLETKNGDKMNPFNSIGMDVLSCIKKLDQKKMDDLITIIGYNPTEFNSYKTQINELMQNSKNVVYSGNLLTNEEIVKGEVKIINSLYKINKKENPSGNVKILYKGHPRDNTVENISRILIQGIKKYYPNPKEADELIKSLIVMDPKIQFEIYLITGFFDSDQATKKEVVLYSTYSTILFLIYADNKIDNIKNIIINEKSKFNSNYILGIYGNNSPIFNTKKEDGGINTGNNKIITVDKLIEMANKP